MQILNIPFVIAIFNKNLCNKNGRMKQKLKKGKNLENNYLTSGSNKKQSNLSNNIHAFSPKWTKFCQNFSSDSR